MTERKLPEPIFRGVGTALITPFRDGAVDLDRFRAQVSLQLTSGIDALVVCGTTGEAALLRKSERAHLLAAAAEENGGRVPLIAGTGSADTREAVIAARYAATHGADALLVVTPYYVKGTAEGVVTHYLRIAEASEKPIIVYNVPSRTGVDLTLSQLKALAAHPNIRAVKEASGDVDKAADIRREIGDRLALYSGNDSLTLPILALGGAGVISVLSNLLPRMAGDVCRLFFSGHTEESTALHLRLLPLCRLLFAETNPAPVKCAMRLLGRDTGELRLPLTPVSVALSAALYEELRPLTGLL